MEKNGVAFQASPLYQERYCAELDAFCEEQERMLREKQKEFKTNNPKLFCRYPQFSKALAKVLDSTDVIRPAATEEQIGNQESVLDFALPSQVREFFLLTEFSKALAKVLDSTDVIRPAATEEQIGNQESVLDFALPSQVREFFLLTAGIDVSTGIIIDLSRTFNLTIHGEQYCVLGEFWKEADGDQLLLRPREETIWYFAHEQNKVNRLCNDMTELLEKKLARYLNEH